VQQETTLMAAITHAPSAAAGLPIPRVRSPFARWAQLWAARRLRNQQMRELHSFSDRELWDVGLSRSDFMAIEQGAYTRD
jgi:uncharacterized protein YjiS (DUF1127 family)